MLPQHFSSVTACARAPGCFDMEQKMQPASRTLLNPESPCTQGCFRSQPDDMMRNYLGGTALPTWQKHHLCYIAAVSLPQFSCCDKYVCCSRHNCSLQIHCRCVAGSAHWGQIFKMAVNSCDCLQAVFWRPGIVSSEQRGVVETLPLTAVGKVSFCVQQTSIHASSNHKFCWFQRSC